jgi:hypothetical protein
MLKYRSFVLVSSLLSAAFALSACTKVASNPQASVPEFPVIAESCLVVKAIKAVDASPRSA